jgi:hypothetical protein
MERLTARAAVETPRSCASPRSRRWAVDIGVTLLILDLLFWIR